MTEVGKELWGLLYHWHSLFFMVKFVNIHLQKSLVSNIWRATWNTDSLGLWHCNQALAGSRESRDPGILSQPKSRDFWNWNPGIFRDFLLLYFGPLGTLLALRHCFFTFSALPSSYLLMERGQHTKTKNKYKANQCDSLSFSKTNIQRDHP